MDILYYKVGKIRKEEGHQEKILVSFLFDLSMSLNCFIFMPFCGRKGGDSNGSRMVAVPETANTTEYGGSNDGCDIHHSNTGH